MSKSYSQARDFLKEHTAIVELEGKDQQRVLLCPEYQGRVMTSSLAGSEGASLGWINYDFIKSGKQDAAFNNYGGEDRFWLGPEGGQYALWFKLEEKQLVKNWFTPPELNTGAFRVVAHDKSSCRMTRRVRVTNASELTFDLEVQRDARLLDARQFEELFGKPAADALGAHGANPALPLVGFETVNTATNVGPIAWDMTQGMVSIWTLGQFAAGERTVIIVPYKQGNEQELGPAVESGYFGPVPSERLKVIPTAILFRADGKFRAKLGVSQKRALPIAGSLDLDSGILTLVHFTMPAKPAEHFYVNNTWAIRQKNAYAGDVFNTYNDGPAEPGAKALGGFYELETLSPTRPLAPKETIAHTHRTFHIKADGDRLERLVKATLNVELADLKKFLAAP
ncbi:MAG TPA: DUF6786 family protein [Pirellulales bacterium]|nr:DUF6786 family protein [Pirellulales bacterium]